MNQYVIIPTFDTVILPDVDCQLGAERLTDTERSRIKIDGGKVLLLPIREEKDNEDLRQEDFFGLGVLAHVESVTDMPGGVRLHVQTREKVRLDDLTRADDVLLGTYTVQEEISDITAKGEADFLEELKKTSIELSGYIQGGQMVQAFIKGCESVHDYAVMFCQFFGMTVEEKYDLLATDSMKARCGMVQESLLRFRGTVEMQIDMNKRYDDSEGNAYKKAAIRKQIGLLEAQLSDLDPSVTTEENEYRAKIEAAGMPEEAKKEADRVLKRYLEAQPNDPEKNMMETWLDFITSLAWKCEEAEPADLRHAREILDRDHYGLSDVKERILQQLAVMTLKGEQGGTILLLVGAPGTGKTSLGKSIAEALGRKYVRIALGGIRDEAEIRGHRRTYIGAMPGRIMEGIKRAGTMNPVVVLDEVDKLMAGVSGDPASALLETLDPEQNHTFTDHYMNVPYDLSHVFFICTANTTDTIPGPLLDRMESISLTGYTEIEKLHIAKEHLIPRAESDAGLKRSQIAISDAAIRKIIQEYTMEAGVRGLKKQFDILCRNAAAKIVEGTCTSVRVGGKNLSDFLGRSKLHHERIGRKNPPGVVTGLAYTPLGGEILFVEATAMPGKGSLILTGHLGDVMKESATISLSLLKSYYSADAKRFEDRDIHIHVPQGAIPKDGPSAGVTLFTALTSLLLEIPADPHLAMTGEVSLRGQVLPIGGLPEKLMAAQRAGVRRVLIPADNEKDLVDVPEEVRESLVIETVETVSELIDKALGVRLPKAAGARFGSGESAAG